MQEHINQALHNESFVASLCETHPDSYFDWKVTATFYTALHLLRAFCDLRDVYLGPSHHDIYCAFDPKKTDNHPITPCPKHMWQNYIALQRYSEQARYDTFSNATVENEIQRDNFRECQKAIKILKEYFHSQGVPCISEKLA